MAAEKRHANLWREGGETVRFALASNSRTVRLAMLIVIVAICWHLML
jgi:hypothetical protein